MPTRRKVEPRKRPRQARSGATVDAILAATAEAVAEDGLEGASVNRIARRAGVSVGSVYQYFPSKDAIVVALIERHTRASIDLLEDALVRTEKAPLEEVVSEAVRAMLEVHRDPLDRALVDALVRLGPLEPIQAEIDRRAGERVARFLVERGLAESEAPLRAFVLVRTVDHLAHALLAERTDVSLEAALAELSRLVLGYLEGGTREKRTRRPGS